MVSRRSEKMVDELVDLVNRQDLIGGATKAMVAYWQEADPDDMDWAFTLEELRPELGAQMLCFQSGSVNVRAPYIATNLQLYVLGYRVGWYERLTTLGGETVSEDSTILDEYYSGGRAVPLIERARQHTLEDRQEWIGLVGLRATPGNNLFPNWAIGGFTTTLALAADEQEYRQWVERFFADKGVEVEDVEPLVKRLSGDPSIIDNETFDLALDLSDSLPVVHASAIHSYSAEEEDDEEERESLF